MIINLGGQTYRVKKIPAIPAKALLDKQLKGTLSPLRQYIEVRDGREWLSLEDEHIVMEFVTDWEVLTELEQLSYDENYGFLEGWKSAVIPHAMAAKFTPAESKYSDPVVTALVTNGLATYKDLRDVYSLEEAFKLLDILTVKKINEHRAAEAAKK